MASEPQLRDDGPTSAFRLIVGQYWVALVALATGLAAAVFAWLSPDVSKMLWRPGQRSGLEYMMVKSSGSDLLARVVSALAFGAVLACFALLAMALVRRRRRLLAAVAAIVFLAGSSIATTEFVELRNSSSCGQAWVAPEAGGSWIRGSGSDVCWTVDSGTVSFEFLDLDDYASPPLRDRYGGVDVAAGDIGGPGPSLNACEYCFDFHPGISVRSQSGWRFLVGGILDGESRVVLVDESGTQTVWRAPGNYVGFSTGLDPEDDVSIYCSVSKGSTLSIATGSFSKNHCGFTEIG